ncbi:unnamed protein product [Clavelina lepadiformis]|uniref:Uncharacterized protein n=1 Tax=Clavelina lepadiformis TaxID=159417 RepID=A0ABP0FH44_CLALP
MKTPVSSIAKWGSPVPKEPVPTNVTLTQWNGGKNGIIKSQTSFQTPRDEVKSYIYTRYSNSTSAFILC